MKRLLRLSSLAAAPLVLGGAKTGDISTALLVGGAGIALLVMLALAFGIVLDVCCRAFVAAEARAIERRTTACVLIGAGVAIAGTFVVALVSPHAPILGLLTVIAASAWFLVGFTGCARRQGERMTGGGATLRPLVLGWLARAGLFAVPLLWPLLAAYLVVAALGAPVVALFERPEPPPST